MLLLFVIKKRLSSPNHHRIITEPSTNHQRTIRLSTIDLLSFALRRSVGTTLTDFCLHLGRGRIVRPRDVGFLLRLGLYFVGLIGLVALAPEHHTLHDDFFNVFSCHNCMVLVCFYVGYLAYKGIGTTSAGLLNCSIDALHHHRRLLGTIGVEGHRIFLGLLQCLVALVGCQDGVDVFLSFIRR